MFAMAVFAVVLVMNGIKKILKYEKSDLMLTEYFMFEHRINYFISILFTKKVIILIKANGIFFTYFYKFTNKKF